MRYLDRVTGKLTARIGMKRANTDRESWTIFAGDALRHHWPGPDAEDIDDLLEEAADLQAENIRLHAIVT